MRFPYRNIRLFILITFSITFYGCAVLLSDSYCKKDKNEESKICVPINIISSPSNLFLEGLKHTIRLFQNKSLSGLIAKEPAETVDRFNKFDLKPGFNFYYPKGSRENAGFLILSVSDPNRNGFPLIEIWDMNLQEKIHSYDINVSNISDSLEIPLDLNILRFDHPLLLRDGSVVINGLPNELGNDPIIRLDKCGEIKNFNTSLDTHHSLEIDKFGNIYTPIYINVKDIKKDNDLYPEGFLADGFVVLDENLNVKKRFDLLDIYEKNNLLGDILGNEVLINDPFHLNDVEPLVTSSGNTYVFLSMRGHSRVMALNIENLSVPWFIDRATLLQHDVDILRFSKDKVDISIFDNNTRMYSDYKNLGNRVAFFSDLPLKTNSEPIAISDQKQFERFKLNYFDFTNFNKEFRPKTKNQGRSDILKLNDSLMVEETNYGRLIEVDISNGNLLWEYYNKGINGSPFMTSWSRRIQTLPGGLNKSSFKSCISN
tara:strand:+ start:381 stop:1838 length:1458 start_codon:yes stop_codon:yes gene_type:complete